MIQRTTVLVVTAAGVEHRFPMPASHDEYLAILESLPAPRSVHEEVELKEIPDAPADRVGLSDWEQTRERTLASLQAQRERHKAAARRDRRLGLFVFLPLGVLVVGFVLWLAVMFGLSLQAERKCLAHGYRDSTVTVTMRSYCIKRVDQSDVVTPLSEVAP